MWVTGIHDDHRYTPINWRKVGLGLSTISIEQCANHTNLCGDCRHKKSTCYCPAGRTSRSMSALSVGLSLGDIRIMGRRLVWRGKLV